MLRKNPFHRKRCQNMPKPHNLDVSCTCPLDIQWPRPGAVTWFTMCRNNRNKVWYMKHRNHYHQTIKPSTSRASTIITSFKQGTCQNPQPKCPYDSRSSKQLGLAKLCLAAAGFGVAEKAWKSWWWHSTQTTSRYNMYLYLYIFMCAYVKEHLAKSWSWIRGTTL